MNADFTALLSDRRLLRVTGEDAEDFLQNVITNDMRRLSAGNIIYACLLTPQGRVLHDFFIMKDGAGYLLDCEAARTDDLLRRFMIFKLRAKVTFGDAAGLRAYAATKGEGPVDPRRAGLGIRIYTEKEMPAEDVSRYYDFCIANGIPCGSLTIRPEKDTMADVNLDLLNAVAWDKGCFIGQEVAARMHHRDLSKRRLFIADGSGLGAGPLMQDGQEAGEIRQASSNGAQALAVVKLSAVGKAAPVVFNGASVTLRPASAAQS